MISKNIIYFFKFPRFDVYKNNTGDANYYKFQQNQLFFVLLDQEWTKLSFSFSIIFQNWKVKNNDLELDELS